MILHHIFSYCCAQREHFCHLSPPAAVAANNIMKCIALRIGDSMVCSRQTCGLCPFQL